MGFLDAAEQVLEQDGQPLHYDEITRRAIAQDLITTHGQSPGGRQVDVVLNTAQKEAFCEYLLEQSRRDPAR